MRNAKSKAARRNDNPQQPKRTSRATRAIPGTGLIPSEETDARPNVHAHFTYREWDTVLAALRHWQQDHDRIENIGMDSSCAGGMEHDQWAIATDHGDALSNDEVDGLCEHINSQDRYPTIPVAPVPVPVPVAAIAVVQGGVLQDIFYPLPDPATKEPFTQLNYDLLDYDVLEGSSDEEIAEYWNDREPSTQTYFLKHRADEVKKFTDAVRRTRRTRRRTGPVS